MKTKVTKPDGSEWVADVVQDEGHTDYVLDGEIYQNAAMEPVMVPNGTTKADLADLLADYGPGTIAYIAGFSAMWQKAADGTWVDI